MESGSRLTRPDVRHLAAIAVLVALVLAAYANTFAVPLYLDDFATIPANRSITKLWPLSTVLFPPPDVYSAGRPVLNLSYALNHAFGGYAVRGYHLTNIAIHALAALTLFGVVRRTCELPRWRDEFGAAATPLALLIAALWALHPAQTVSVTYLSQRAESLMGLFYLLTLYTFLRAVDTKHVGWRVASVALCALGMATKEVMATAPLVVFLVDAICVTCSWRETLRARWRYHLTLASTWLIVAGLMLGSELSRRAVGTEHGLTWYNYARIEVRAVLHYLRLAVWPNPLIFDYGPSLELPGWRELMSSGVVLVSLLGVSIHQLIRQRVVGLLGVTFFLLLAPTSSVIPIAGQPIAENRLYLPTAVIVAALVVGAYRAGPRLALPALGLAVPALAIAAFQRNGTYQDPLGLWRDTVAKQPTNMRAWVYLSDTYRAKGRPEDALKVIQQALRYRPDSAELHNNLAVALYTLGRVAEAIEHFQTAIRLKPTYHDAYFNFGAVLYHTGNVQPALDCFLRSAQLHPAPEPHFQAGLCFARLGQLSKAVEHYQAALRLDPNHQGARASLDAMARGG